MSSPTIGVIVCVRNGERFLGDALRSIQQQRIAPHDILVVGAGNSLLSSHGVSGISTVDTNDKWIGQEAFRLLLERMDSTRPDRGVAAVHSKSQVIQRTSTSRCTE